MAARHLRVANEKDLEIDRLRALVAEHEERAAREAIEIELREAEHTLDVAVIQAQTAILKVWAARDRVKIAKLKAANPIPVEADEE